MKLTVVLAILVGILIVACSTAAPAPAEPTPNIDATVEAKLAQERAVDATVEARLAEERASQATSIPSPTNSQAAMPTYTPHPTYTPKPAPTNTPTSVPNATAVPTPTPRPISTPTPVPTPIPTKPLVYSSCKGKLITFKIGNVWAAQSVIWQEGAGDILNLTASSAILTSKGGTSWPISAAAQRVASHVVVGSVSAADGTSISAWDGNTQLASTNAAGGSYSLMMEHGKCVSTSTSFEGGFVMIIGGSFGITGEIAFKVGNNPAQQTLMIKINNGNFVLRDLYAVSSDFQLPYTTLIGSGSIGVPPHVIAGRAYIDGEYAPDGTLVTAWIGGEEIIEARTTVVNSPVAVVPTELVSKLDTYIPPPSPLPTPCPVYKPCGEPDYSGRLADDIEFIWNNGYESGRQIWRFYNLDPAWRLANNFPEDICHYVGEGGDNPFEENGMCYGGDLTWTKKSISFDKQANGLEWTGRRLQWPVKN